jgi:amphi-Trp domain-containing protein
MPNVRIRQDLSAEEAAERISELALGLSTGDLWLDADGRRNYLHPESPVRLEIRSSESSREGKLSIELSWKVGLRITSP